MLKNHRVNIAIIVLIVSTIIYAESVFNIIEHDIKCHTENIHGVIIFWTTILLSIVSLVRFIKFRLTVTNI